MKIKFDSIVFTGGGMKCFWQAGFWQTISPNLKELPTEVMAVNTGALIACLIFSDRLTEGMGSIIEVANENSTLPPYAIYSNIINSLIDKETFSALKENVDIKILLSRPPDWMGPASSSITEIVADKIEKIFPSPRENAFVRRMGFRQEAVSVKKCKKPGDLAELLLQSSSTPVRTPILKPDNNNSLKGSFSSNIQASILDENKGQTLVLLTEKYPQKKIPQEENRIYAQPSKSIEIKEWDFSNPKGIKDAYDVGTMDGKIFLSNITIKDMGIKII
ncbi:patatin-like phospholipase family protein [Spirochaetota bacterium]